MGKEYGLGPTSELPSGKVVGAGPYAVGNRDGEYFAVTRRCRHFGADLANGSIDADGCLVCPWHQSKYDVVASLDECGAVERVVDRTRSSWSRALAPAATCTAGLTAVKKATAPLTWASVPSGVGCRVAAGPVV
jgi:hypothetical protein